jgi:cell wall-associated NlpC family hydrolase
MFAVASMPGTSVELPRVAAFADQVRKGNDLPGWDDGRVPYSWGGGHARRPGPSRGTCWGYSGRIRPCPAAKTVGLDCSGLARWVYYLAFGKDVLGRGNTDQHLRRFRRIAAEAARPGDLVFYGKATRTHHVGVYVGHGEMINALRTGTRVRVDKVAVMDDLIGYYRLKAAL